MLKLSKINEGLIGNMWGRAGGTKERKEDLPIININDLHPIDMGGNVLWASDDIIYQESYHIPFNEINDILKKTDWRLPTLKDLEELDDAEFKETPDSYILTKNGNKLKFEKRGFYYHAMKRIQDEHFYYGWTSDEMPKYNKVHIITFDAEDGLIHSPSNNPQDYMFNSVVQDKNDELCVRLVKDKKREE